MREELSQALLQDLPNLFFDEPFLFQCGDGWEPLLRKSLQELETMRLNLKAPEQEKVKIMQVKEKWVRLNVYLSWSTDEMTAWMIKVLEESGKVCESCGAPGVPRPGGWVKTLCDACHEKANMMPAPE